MSQPDDSGKVEASRRHFDSWARTYEEDRSARWLQEVQHEVLAALGLGASDSLLDVGCGTGAAVREAAPRVARAVGVDLSPVMLERAGELAQGLPNVEFHEVDTRDPLPFGDDEFTAVMCTTAFHHFPRPEHALREMARVLAPGGRLVIADLNADGLAVRSVDFVLRHAQPSHVGFMRPRRLIAAMTDAGLSQPDVRTLWRGSYALVRAVKESTAAAR